MTDVLLMTSAIQSPAAFSRITDHTERLVQTLCSLLRWIDTSFETIVLCDGTEPTYDFSRIAAHAAARGTTLETLLFRESDAYLTHGKSYAEGEVLAYALEHSAHLREGAFYKVTGRTFVENVDALRNAHARDNVVFDGPASMFLPHGAPDPYGLRSVWTQFYKCETSLFRTHLLNAYTVTDDRTNPIECEYARRLEHMPHTSFRERPFIVGRNGGTNLPYDADFDQETRTRAESFL